MRQAIYGRALALLRHAVSGWAALSGAALMAAVATLFMSGGLGAAREEPAAHVAQAAPVPAAQGDAGAAVIRQPLLP